MKTFIVELWAAIFSCLAWISPFKWVRTCFQSTKSSYLFVDIWVLSHFILSFLLVILFRPANLSFGKLLAVGYGSLRLFEIMVYQINVLFFDEYRAKKLGKKYAVRGFRRLVLLLLHNYAEIVFWYALGYLTFNTAFQNGAVTLHTASQALSISFNTMTTFGIATTTPIETIGFILVFSQAVIGLFMTLIVLARFIALIPSPATLDEFEKTRRPLRCSAAGSMSFIHPRLSLKKMTSKVKKNKFLKISCMLLILVGVWQQSASWVGAIDLETECRLYKEKAGSNFKKIDINKATEKDLITLPGIGIKTARAIVAYRETIGGYKSLEQLQLVRGVGEKVYDCLKDLVTVGESP